MRRIYSAVLLFLATAALPACTNTCSHACDNIAKVCADNFVKQKRTFDPALCTENCKANLNGCSNISDQVNCSVKAQQCEDLAVCPSCF